MRQLCERMATLLRLQFSKSYIKRKRICTHSHTHMYSDTYFHDKEEGWGREVREEPCKHVNGNLWHFSTINSTWTKRKFSSLKWICYGRVCMCVHVWNVRKQTKKLKNAGNGRKIRFLSLWERVCVRVCKSSKCLRVSVQSKIILPFLFITL